MRKHWKKLTILVVTAAMVGLTACGSKESAPSASQSPSVQEAAKEDKKEEQKPAESGETYKFRISNIQTGSSPIGQAIEHMMKIAEEKSGGRLEFEHYPGGTLGADRVNIENAQAGTVEIGNSSTSNLTTFIEEFKALELPYITIPENDETLYASLDSGELGEYFKEKFNAIGLQPLAYYSQGYRIFLTVPETPLTCVSDFKNVKLRSTSSEVELALDNALGASPTPLPASETYTALQQRTVEGNNGAICFAYDNNYHEICKNILKSNHNFLLNVVVINKEIYDSLPDDLRQILDESFAESVTYERELMDQAINDAFQSFEEAGCTITELEGEKYDEFVTVATSIYDKFATSDAIKEAIEEIKKTQIK